LESKIISDSDKKNTNTNKLEELEARRSLAQLGGGEEKNKTQKKKGKLLARERLSLLFDNGEFEEFDQFITHRSQEFGLDKQKYEGDSVVCGVGQVNGKQVFAFSQDFTVLGGSLSEVASMKICKLMDHAVKTGCPVVGINDSGGARIQEGVESLAGYGEIFRRNTMASGVIPQITVIAGPSAGGAVYSPALTDFIFMVEEIGQMYITGPEVIQAVTGEKVNHQELGGSKTHSQKSGVVHVSTKNETECFNKVRELLSYLPSNNLDDPENLESSDSVNRISEKLKSIIPNEANQSYDMKEIIREIVDSGKIFEIHKDFAPNIITCLSRFNGQVVGIVANQPLSLAGVLDIDASVKAARFVRFCDAFNIPILTLVDVPGFMPGVNQEFGGIIRHGAKLLYAYSEATVPKITIIVRKAYGGAYIVMGSKELRSDINLAWPSAEIAVMGPEGAVKIISRKIIQESENKEETQNKLVEEYKDKFANPFVAASRGYLDDVIDPSTTRSKIISSLKMLQTKSDNNIPKKHGNIPL
tara:strand:- start:3029 stop:4615 length:1587 start_codon:yes stop_codon:yes gene_type:complete